MIEFNRAIEFTLKWEGGYINDPNDPGGETNFGISKRAFPHLNIKKLTEAEAKDIYRANYWNKLKAYNVPYLTSVVLFDFAVNAGRDRAVKYLQQIVNVKQDGDIGPKTLAAIYAIDDLILSRMYLDRRLKFYIALARANTKMRRYLYGWCRRTQDCTAYITELYWEHYYGVKKT